jgi:hypothetical protein
MFERFRSKSLTATAAGLLAALGVGGVALAQSGTSATKTPAPATAPAAESTTGPDTDSVQQGDQTTPDVGSATASSAAASSTPEAPGAAEAPGASEAPGAPEAAGSETGPSDGPGGYADNPNDASANTQQQGQN